MASDPNLQAVLLAEVRPVSSDRLPTQTVAKPAGLIKATTLRQGQEIFYTVRLRNNAQQAVTGVDVVQPVPGNTRFIADSATGAGTRIQFSVDGGRTYVESRALPKPLRSASGQLLLSNVTHIRWQLQVSLPPKAVLLARFRAEFQ